MTKPGRDDRVYTTNEALENAFVLGVQVAVLPPVRRLTRFLDRREAVRNEGEPG